MVCAHVTGAWVGSGTEREAAARSHSFHPLVVYACMQREGKVRLLRYAKRGPLQKILGPS